MRRIFCSFIVMAFVALLWVNIAPTVAAPAPSIKVNPVWRPASQLTTIDTNSNGQTDSGDDIRYVVADIYSTTNVEFWAVGFTCTVNKAALESYIQNGDPGSTEDNVALLTNGADWGSPAANQFVDTTDVDGKFNFAISVIGQQNPPMGSNGVSKTLHIASLKYRVKETLTSATTSTFICTTNFLDRDGKTVLAATYVAPPALSIIPGYTVTGKVTYQGTTTTLTAGQAIDVQCDDSDPDVLLNNVVTTANITTGLFSVTNLRTQGRYDCQFIGNIRSAGSSPDLHLTGYTDFNLSTGSFALLPVELKSGNTNSNNGTIDGSDLLAVTSNWHVATSAPYLLGDASGNKKVDEADLAILGSNYARIEPIRSNHLIYSLPRDVNAFQNSHLWLGENTNASVKPFLVGTTRDYWPALSPNGAKIAFIRNVGTGTADKFALFTAPVANGVVGAATRLTPPSATYDAFAPSWSPDGSQLAFVCSENHQWSNLVAGPSGSLCLMDAGGANFRIPIEATTHQLIRSKIQNPAWINEQIVYVAYAPDPVTISSLDNRICRLSLINNVLSTFAALPTGTDMPAVRNGILGRTLFYRFDNGGGSRTIRYAQITSNGAPIANYPNTTPGTLHTDLPSLSTLIDYFTISTGDDPHLIYYQSDPVISTPGGSTFSIRNFIGTPAAPNWAPELVSFYTIASAVENPAFASGYNAALRNTVVFAP